MILFIYVKKMLVLGRGRPTYFNPKQPPITQ